MDWVYPSASAFGSRIVHELTDEEINRIPWAQATESCRTIDRESYKSFAMLSYPRTFLSDRLPVTNAVFLKSTNMHSFMMGEHPRLGQVSPVRMLEGKREICLLIKNLVEA